MRRFIWGEVHKKAVQLSYEDRLKDEQIARECAICRRTLSRWRHREEYKRYRSQLSKEGKERMFAELNREWDERFKRCREEAQARYEAGLQKRGRRRARA